MNELDIRGILAALVEEGVEFLVIGGLAVGYHGYVRATKDVDLHLSLRHRLLGDFFDQLIDAAV